MVQREVGKMLESGKTGEADPGYLAKLDADETTAEVEYRSELGVRALEPIKVNAQPLDLLTADWVVDQGLDKEFEAELGADDGVGKEPEPGAVIKVAGDEGEGKQKARPG